MDAGTEEAAISALATGQRGIVTAGQLRMAGFTRGKIKHRLRRGTLRSLHRGVYLVGHAPVPDGAPEMAATLACGDDSLISHRSGARLWKLDPFVEWDGPVEISIAGRNVGRKAGLRIYRISSIDRRDVRSVDNIRVTSPARTLLDLAPVLPLRDVELAAADALGRGLVTDQELRRLLDRNRGRRGAEGLRRLVELLGTDGLTRSEAERKLRALLRKAGLPTPRSNVRLHGFPVDFLWPDENLVIEVDGYAFHSGRKAFERDRLRDATLHAQTPKPAATPRRASRQLAERNQIRTRDPAARSTATEQAFLQIAGWFRTRHA